MQRNFREDFLGAICARSTSKRQVNTPPLPPPPAGGSKSFHGSLHSHCLARDVGGEGDPSSPRGKGRFGAARIPGTMTEIRLR